MQLTWSIDLEYAIDMRNWLDEKLKANIHFYSPFLVVSNHGIIYQLVYKCFYLIAEYVAQHLPPLPTTSPFLPRSDPPYSEHPWHAPSTPTPHHPHPTGAPVVGKWIVSIVEKAKYYHFN